MACSIDGKFISAAHDSKLLHDQATTIVADCCAPPPRDDGCSCISNKNYAAQAASDFYMVASLIGWRSTPQQHTAVKNEAPHDHKQALEPCLHVCPSCWL
jgi:hypothetical protein